VEKPDVPESTVVEQVRKGYMLKGRVIRPTIVKVAVKPSQSNKTEEKTQ